MFQDGACAFLFLLFHPCSLCLHPPLFLSVGARVFALSLFLSLSLSLTRAVMAALSAVVRRACSARGLMTAVTTTPATRFAARRCFASQNPFLTTPDTTTHTGQKFAVDDPRNARFVNDLKEVNTNVAADLIDQVPPIVVDGRKVACDGGDGNLGHPKVFINLDQPGPQACGYCGLRFVQAEH
eukprot:m.407736 g.407736  ORF g.407736 m.407736 type:complete len:183 (-) comp20140_c1_seq21:175-723(-)